MDTTNNGTDQRTPHGLLGIGGAALLVSVMLCGSAHLILRHGASDLDGRSLWAVFLNLRIVFGLAIYGFGTVLWLYCLGKLDLSLAFPASAIQFVLVFVGAKWILGESIPTIRLVGGGVILIGIVLLFFERRTDHA